MLWSELPNLTPLVRCLPDVSSVDSQGVYSFQRELENADWETLRKYTSRVRVLSGLRDTSNLAVDCVNQLSNPPNADKPLFPKLQLLMMYEISPDLYPFVLRHLTSLRLEDLTLEITGNHGSVLRSFGHLCPNINRFKAIESGPYAEIISDLVCHWSNLQHVTCYEVVLPFAALSRLSILPNVLSLAFTVNDAMIDQFPDISPLPFPALDQIHINSGSLVSLWRLFHRIRLPVLHRIILSLPQVHPTPANLLTVFTTLGEACAHESLRWLSVWSDQNEISTIDDPSPFRLTFRLLRPLTVFHNLQSITLDVLWDVDLNESELLTLASSWPHLTRLELGDKGDWTLSSGITPDGFVRLIELCKSLRVLFVILNTQGYTEIPRGHPWRGRAMPKNTFIDLLNSPIEEDSIEALGAFFQVAPYPHFNLTTLWNNRYFRGRRPQARESPDTYYERWSRAREIARDLSDSRRKLLKSIETQFTGLDPTRDSDSENSLSDE